MPVVVQTPVASTAPAAPASAVASVEASAVARANTPLTSSPETTATEPKKHNAVVRALGKIFRKKDKHPESTSDSKDLKSAARSAGTKSEQ
jgi:hypothetical protein